VHPGAPVCAAALAIAQLEHARGVDLLVAIALGVEATCRLSKAVSVAPAVSDISWYQTGICGGAGAAIAAGTLLRLDRAADEKCDRHRRRAGIGQPDLAGEHDDADAGRATRRSRASRAALLAREGFESPQASIEGTHGFAAVFSKGAHLDAVTVGPRPALRDSREYVQGVSVRRRAASGCRCVLRIARTERF
jgi:2-methylcitrate dehydratase PrpD